MKKIFLMAAVTAVALSSCSKNEVKVNPSDPTNAIGFGSYLGTNTKAVVEDEFVEDDVMSVVAYATGTADFNTASATITPFMTNVDVAKGATTADPLWSYSPLKYWPKNKTDKLSFFAVSDASAKDRDFNELNSLHAANFSYTNPATAATQVDLMAGSELNLVSSTGSAVDGNKVNFTFKHILSQIKFSFKTDKHYGTDVVKLTKVTVDYADAFYADAVFSFDQAEESKGTWAIGSATPQIDEEFDFTTSPISLTDAANTTAIAPIMIVPQNAELKLTVEYTVNQVDGTGDDAVTTTFTESFTSASLTPATDGFVQNTVYTYPVTISLNAIVFGEPTIDTNSWVPTGGSEIAIPTV